MQQSVLANFFLELTRRRAGSDRVPYKGGQLIFRGGGACYLEWELRDAVQGVTREYIVRALPKQKMRSLLLNWRDGKIVLNTELKKFTKPQYNHNTVKNMKKVVEKPKAVKLPPKPSVPVPPANYGYAVNTQLFDSIFSLTP